MTDQPIIFTAAHVLAAESGGKNQHRVVIDPQPDAGNAYRGQLLNANEALFGSTDLIRHCQRIKLPAKVGDRLWVQENWCLCGQMNDVPLANMSKFEPVGYLADGNIRQYGAAMLTRGKDRIASDMPRWASRMTLTVTEVRVQRLHDVTLGEICAEIGVESIYHFKPVMAGLDAFSDHWKSIHGPDAWDKNPYVAALTFDVHKCNIDMMESAV